MHTSCVYIYIHIYLYICSLCEGAVVMSMCMNLVVMAAPWAFYS